MALSNFAFLSAFISLALGEIFSREILEWVRFKFFGDGVFSEVGADDTSEGWRALIV
jgi:hypothetical protein